MNIGILIGRIGGVDGVALETEKWIDVLNKMGHKTFILSGQFEDRKLNSENERLAPSMSFFSAESIWEQRKAFHNPDGNKEKLLEHIETYASIIEEEINNWIKDYKIDIAISENASALPAHLSMGIAIKKTFEKNGIPIITHDHDFAWERGERYVSPYPEIMKIVDDVFPLRIKNSFHAVINLNGQRTLKERFDRDSIVVPNVMNFDIPYGVLTNHNKRLKSDLGFKENDILLAQVTRIVRRKGIEVAIKLVDKLNDPKVRLIVTGNANDDEGASYFEELTDLVVDLNLKNKVVCASHMINNMGLNKSDKVLYSLSDAYANANSCTYFSTYEGFGNAFVEAVLSKTPIFVNNYKPVYWPDIGSKGFKTVMLENNNLTDQAVKDMAEIIYNKKLNKEIAEYNFNLGKKYFSYETLETKLKKLLLIFEK